jgi:hypothetical protein
MSKEVITARSTGEGCESLYDSGKTFQFENVRRTIK